MSTSITTIRLDENIKKDLQKNLDSIGITMNTYFVMAAKQLVMQKKIPFDIFTETEIPNKTTRKAMLLADAKEAGLIPDDSQSFDNVDDFMQSLHGDNV